MQGARAPDSLAHLASNQLRRLLVTQLEAVPARRRQSQALLQRPLHAMLPPGEARRPSKDWPVYSEEEECEICFMHALACDFSTCSHGVCKDCALALCGSMRMATPRPAPSAAPPSGASGATAGPARPSAEPPAEPADAAGGHPM